MAHPKTNAMRMLDKAKIEYKVHEYPHDDHAVDGQSVAKLLGQDPKQVFKTLVTQGASKEYYVFAIPVLEELDLKKAAKAVGEKRVEMIAVSEINKVTGYIRGGCSPVGMKKSYTTVFDQSIEQQSYIMVSGGKIGTQIELSAKDLIALCHAKVEFVTTGKYL